MARKMWQKESGSASWQYYPRELERLVDGDTTSLPTGWGENPKDKEDSRTS